MTTDSGFLPIADHGLIGDLHTAALVGTDGTIDWYCPGRFDGPSAFASLLDADAGGFWRLSPARPGVRSRQLYLPDTDVLVTRFFSDDGVAEIEDFMPIDGLAGHRSLVRRVMCVRGRVDLKMQIEPRFDYARRSHRTDLHEGGAVFDPGEESPLAALALASPLPLQSTEQGACANFSLESGESAAFVLQTLDGNRRPPRFDPSVTEQAFDETVAYWRDWLARSTYQGRWREMVNRSALTLKLLTYKPTGAIVAAPTTSLPERLGGSRNWDYRYTWIRDAAFTVYAFIRLGFTEEASAFMGWLTARFRGGMGAKAPGHLGPLQVVYGIDGATELPEQILDHLTGYQQSGPVRIGNEAANQFQLDIYGELVDSVYLYNKYGSPLSARDWDDLSAIVDWVCEHWDQPDDGIWEVRGDKARFTTSRVMSWVALERAVRVARQRGLPADIVQWSAERDRIYRQLMERGWSEERQAFTQRLDGHSLDASVLLMPLVKFIAPTDPQWLSTLDAIGDELVTDSLVHRYRSDGADDGLQGDEGTFSMCTFWYVEALTRAGRLDEARLVFEKMLTYANHLGLYSEEIGPSGDLLGNFPQAFTHLSLISAACNLDSALG